jgi:hypothetical protein
VGGMIDKEKDQTERVTAAMEKIASCLEYLCTQGVFVKIDEDISEN